jgi:hypothetical protein
LNFFEKYGTQREIDLIQSGGMRNEDWQISNIVGFGYGVDGRPLAGSG